MTLKTALLCAVALLCYPGDALFAAPQQSAVNKPLSPDLSPQELVESLRAAHTDWRSRLNVRGDYSAVSGFVRDRTDLFNPKAIRPPGTRSGGFFAVAGQTVRVKRMFEGAAAPADQASQLKANTPVSMHNISTDEVYDGDTFLEFRPEQPSLAGSTAQITRMMNATPSAQGVRELPCYSLHVLDPVISFSHPPGAMPGEPHPLPAADEYDVEWITDSTVRLTAVFEKRSADGELTYTTEYTADWRLDLAVPMLVSYRHKYTLPHKPPKLHEVYIRDICESSELPFGRHVVTVSAGSLVRANGEPVDLLDVSHWRSPEACEVAPTADDFAIELPAGTSVAGLKGLAVTQKPTTIAIAELSDDDYLRPGDSVPHTPPVPVVLVSRDVSLWLWMVNGAFLALVAGYLLYRRLTRA